MPDEYFFRGTIPQFWNVVHAEYLRLYRSLEREPFEFTEPHPHKQPLAEYTPTENSTIMMVFWNIEHTYKILVDAEYSPDREMVQVMVFFNQAFTKGSESALAVWREVKNALKKDQRLIDPANSADKPQKPEPDSHLDIWFDYYHAMKAAGKKYTFKDLARDSFRNAGHIANMHGNYKKERGLK